MSEAILTASVSERTLAPEVRLAEFIPTKEGLAVKKQATVSKLEDVPEGRA